MTLSLYTTFSISIVFIFNESVDSVDFVYAIMIVVTIVDCMLKCYALEENARICTHQYSCETEDNEPSLSTALTYLQIQIWFT